MGLSETAVEDLAVDGAALGVKLRKESSER